MVRGNIRARRDHLRGPRTTFRKAFLPRPPFDLARFDLAFQKDATPSADDNDLTNVSNKFRNIKNSVHFNQLFMYI